MKKVLSMVLVLLMVMGSMATAFAAENTLLIAAAPAKAPVDVAGTSYEEAVRALMNANVVSGYKDGTFRPANTLTRAEACAFLVNYLAPTEEERNAALDSGFSDVTGWAVTFVNYAVEKGIVAGYKDGTFRPGNQVTYQEMAAMTVNALGIDPETLTGGWPDAYINKAKELGMYENISVAKKNQDQANRGDVAEMIYSLIKYKDTPAKDSVMEKLVGSNAALANAESMSYEMFMEMAMAVGEESMDMTSVMKMDMILDPMTMYMKADMTGMGESQIVEYYYLTEGDELVMYMLQEGQWYKMSMGDALTAAIPANPAEDMELYLNAYDNVRIEGKDVVNGTSATKIYCELGQEYMDEIMAEMGSVEDMIGEIPEEDEELLESIFASMKGFGYEMWIDDETGHLVKVRMDMSDLMETLMAQIMSSAIAADPSLSGEEFAIRVDKMLVEMIVTNIDAVDEIEIPAELKDAIDLGASAE
ncbi:MAG: S-layer homology domain-containing protein [Firmicutes bacterium]|nr:S-layer homology domain-containing protein [Bacillota bacterium]